MKTQVFKLACLIICLLTIVPNCHAGSKWKAKHVVSVSYTHLTLPTNSLV